MNSIYWYAVHGKIDDTPAVNERTA